MSDHSFAQDRLSPSLGSDKITHEHSERRAVVYVRQSTPQQVLEHRESTARQYALVDRAVTLGWPRSAVEVIDEDQGQSAASAQGRSGFQRLLGAVGSDEVGLILGLEMSRLARSCKDWHTLLEVCSIYRTLLADAEGLYDPSQYNDRLLLGLKGTLSEAELHTPQSRMREGARNKAARGELLNHPPIGYARDRRDDFVIDPDEQVQAVVRMISEQFLRQGSVNRLLRWLVRNEVRMPVRPHFGENRGELEWRAPNRVTLLNLPHHPIYAGAYRWGHREIDPRRKVPGRPTTGRTFNTHDECRVLIRDRFPAYIDWEQFEENQRILSENSHLGKMLSAPKHGPSVLSGLVVCGRCGHRMMAGYGTSGGESKSKNLRYGCQRDAIDYGLSSCQSLSGAVLESLVIEQLLHAVSPASLELSLSVTESMEEEHKQLAAHWQQRLQRSRYDVEQARRAYMAVDPEHRLVARELEGRWEQALEAEAQLQAEHARFERASPREISEIERERILKLSEDLPSLWDAESTRPEDRQSPARTLLEEVRVTVGGDSERVGVQLHWAGGFVSDHLLIRPVQTYEQLSYHEAMVTRIDALREEGRTLSEIATTLNEEGFRPPKRATRFSKGILSGLLRERAIRQGTLEGRRRDGELLGCDEWWLSDLANALSMPLATLHRWRRVGWVRARKVEEAGGCWALYADAEELDRLRQLRDAPRGWPQVYPSELTTPKQA